MTEQQITKELKELMEETWDMEKKLQEQGDRRGALYYDGKLLAVAEALSRLTSPSIAYKTWREVVNNTT